MVTRLRSRISLAVATIGIGFTLATLTLPLVRTHQTVAYPGPTSPYGNSDTTLSGYLIPSVAQGTAINILITGYTQNSLSFSMFATDEGALSPSGALVPLPLDFSQPQVSASFVSPATQAYGIYIASKNHTQFVIALDGYWSSFTFLKGYSSEGLFVTLVGIFGYFYFINFERRRAVEESAVKGIATAQGAEVGRPLRIE